jgi:hypothetical protein
MSNIIIKRSFKVLNNLNNKSNNNTTNTTNRIITDPNEIKTYLTKEKIEVFDKHIKNYIHISKEIDKKIINLKNMNFIDILNVNNDLEYDLLLELMNK